MADIQLRIAIATVSSLMDEIAAVFKPGAKITVMVRRPDEPTTDFMLTSDSIPELRAMLDRREAAEVATHQAREIVGYMTGENDG